MGDPFEQMQQFYRALDQGQQHERSCIRIAEHFEETVRRAMQMDKALAASNALCQFKPIDAAYDSIRNLIPRESLVFAQMDQQEARWRNSMDGVLAQVGKAASLTSLQQSFMAQDMAQLRIVESLKTFAVFNRSDALAFRLMEPQFAYADFVSGTAARLAQSTSPMAASALRASLRLAETQLITTSDALARAIGSADVVADTPVLKGEASLVIPSVQQQELLIAGMDFSEADLDAVVDASPAAQASELSVEILLLVTQCNEASKIAGKGDIFKPTNRMLEVFARLPWALATDKNQLADIVDYLFWTLYEGGGDDKLRFVQANGGWMDADECDEVFRIKYLRNKWLRHDPDHGNESKIGKTWQDVSGALQGLGLNGMPVTETDYRVLQRHIFQQIKVFLDNLLARIVRSQ